MIKKIPLFALVLLIVSAVDSIRNLPANALFGSPLIFFFALSAILFLIPISLVAAELSATFPEHGGVYHWVHRAFGEKMGMLAIWLQWVNTMVWYPTILSFIAGTAVYLINPELAQSKTYFISSILLIFWGLTFINLFGLHISAKVNSVCVLIGTVLPMLLLIALGVVWVAKGSPLQIEFTKEAMAPSLAHPGSWISLVAIMASFLGMELAGVHVNDIHNPQKNFPKALLLGCIFIVGTMLPGSLAIASVLPAEEINLVAGVIQVFASIFKVFGMEWCSTIMTVLIVIGSVGLIINWLISPAKGLLHAAEFGFMPPFFSKKNRHGVASRILLAQAVLVSLVCLVVLLVPSINAFYWFLTALSTELYMIMYVIIFFAAIRLHYKYIDRPKVFKIPGKQKGLWLTCTFGLIGCFATLVVGFFPPEYIHIESTYKFASMMGIGSGLMVLPVTFFYFYKFIK